MTTDRRDSHQTFIKKLRDEHEQRTGHTPTDKEQRQIENRAENIARKYDVNQEKRKR